MKKKLQLLKFTLFCSVLLYGGVLKAQINYYSLKITVTAETGVSVEGTPVLLANDYTGMTYEDNLPASGILEYSNLLEGTYKLTITKEGLKPYVNDNLVLNSNQDLQIELKENVVTPYRLNSSVNYDEQTGKGIVDFTWNNDDVFFDNFEDYQSFSISFSPWTGIDMDKASPAQMDITFPNFRNPQYATIFNPAETTPSRLGSAEMMPYSGLKCIAFLRADGVPNNDWLIAPKKLIKDGDVVSFMAKALGVNYKEEQFRVAVSTSGNTNVNDFVVISKGNSEDVGGTWTKFEYDLSAYAGQEVYVAINYMSIYRQMLMVDDFFIGKAASRPKLGKSKRVSSSVEDVYPQYAVYLDGQEKARVTELGYQFDQVDGGTHTLGVKAIYEMSETAVESINVTVDPLTVFASFTVNVTTNNSQSADGVDVYLTNKDAGIIYNKKVENGKIIIPFARKGNYEISIQKSGYKAYSGEHNLTADANLTATLEEEIIKPYNLTVDVEKNTTTEKFDATFVWNQNLGWTDGFESYADFTQKPAPWITHDLDKVVSYPIGWGPNPGQEYAFPGIYEPMGPVVFNPLKTTPPMPVDVDKAAAAPEGEKYIAFFSAQMAKSNDWLISPKQDIKRGYVLRFLLKSYPMIGITDKINVCFSGTENVADFKIIDEITPSNENWVLYELSLADYEGKSMYVGFNFVSYDGFLVQLDEVYVGPSSKDAETENVKEFEVYLNDALATKTTSNTYKFEGLEPSTTYKAGVKAVYESGISEMSEYEFTTPSLNSITSKTANDALKVYPSYIKAGSFTVDSEDSIEQIQLYNTIGQCVKTVEAKGERNVIVDVQGLPDGVYYVKVVNGKDYSPFKIIITK
ncbi:MAG: choice-of-anchor J domain-containing protein [Dysgonomonas sp.]